MEIQRNRHGCDPDRLERIESAVHVLPTAVNRLKVPIRPYAMVDMSSLQVNYNQHYIYQPICSANKYTVKSRNARHSSVHYFGGYF